MSEDQPLAPRVSALEANMAAMQASLAAMEIKAAEHRAEEKSILSKIADKVEAIAAEQILERGRREGAATTAAPVRDWMKTLLPYAAAIAVVAAGAFVTQNQRPQQPPTIVVNPPAVINNAPRQAPQPAPTAPDEVIEEEFRR